MAYNQGQPYGFNPQQQNPQYGWNAGGQQQQQQGFNPVPPPYAGGQYQSVPVFSHNPNYAESGEGPKMDVNFNDQTIRAAFVRKVFVMVGIMLAVVAVMTAIPFIHEDTKLFIKQSPGLYLTSYFVFLVVYIALMCCESVRRSFPANLICTAVLTLAIGYMTMMLAATKDLVPVLLCLVITSVCCGGIILFSMQTKHDLTSMMGFVAIASMVLMVFGLVAIISVAFFHVQWMYTIYAGLAALLFMVYLAIDIQMIMGGRKLEISPEDHVFAAIQVFLDIVYIFWMLLQLIGGSNN
ncbi:unnamed protein product [Bursaphelenchus xylophilus]|uniref:(pine wood nematode) hypothetical protein n=1 Tax=Bursaphelenchus xylophilus TaxID=6326 RepID=A0A7I8X5V4_BURXY|nr:unnamed protein product [Bursaphelenchus xylophilus]CAG9122092.1 unnamed protein product [Bursaphelenchus xylophilus]